MPAKTKPSKAKTHTNPKGRVAFFCYLKPKTLRTIKTAVKHGAKSQGHVVDIAFHGNYVRPIA
jgi:hypothetical protein